QMGYAPFIGIFDFNLRRNRSERVVKTLDELTQLLRAYRAHRQHGRVVVEEFAFDDVGRRASGNNHTHARRPLRIEKYAPYLAQHLAHFLAEGPAVRQIEFIPTVEDQHVAAQTLIASVWRSENLAAEQQIFRSRDGQVGQAVFVNQFDGLI